MWVLRMHRYMAVDESEELSDIIPYLESIGLKPRIDRHTIQSIHMLLPRNWKVHKEIKLEGVTFRVVNNEGTDMFTFRGEGRAFIIHHRPGQDEFKALP